jgi:O-antigen ligase
MHRDASIRTSVTSGDVPAANVWLAVTACIAIAVPTLIAFNVAPSATFFNQAAAFVGWGGFLLLVSAEGPRWPFRLSQGTLALLVALTVLLIAALVASLWASAPWSLSLSSAATIASAILTVTVSACAARAGMGARAFRAFCIALVIAGIANAAIGLIQVFAPTLPDGDWVALSAIPGRATGNLRQPNHLSSLLLWSIVAVVLLGESKPVFRKASAVLALVFIYVIVLSASRTGAVGMLTLAAWGLFDRRLSRDSRFLLILAPIAYGACWWGMTEWANVSHHIFGGQTRFGGSGDISSSRFGIWSNTLSLIKMHPWFGVGFGEFNFAWTLTPFPGRPGAFFDHTHDIVLNFVVELGLPLALLVTALLLFALWKALGNAIADGREGADGASPPVPFQRAALVIVVMVGVHSMLEYPLWYAYFLLPAAFAFGLCLERPDPAEIERAAMPEANVTRPFVLASMLLILCGTLAVYDYMRVVVIFAPRANAAPLDKRIADGRRSVLFSHHADYAAATVAEHPGQVIKAFDGATHYLLDARLMMAWAKALDERGETDKARYVAQRLQEFHNEQAAAFFAPCASKATSWAAPAAAVPASAAASVPFQCLAPTRQLGFEDFR